MKGTMTNKTIKISPHLLHRWGQLMCDVLDHGGHAQEMIGTSYTDMETQVDYILEILKDNKEYKLSERLEDNYYFHPPVLPSKEL